MAEKLLMNLNEAFGFDSFRPGQKEAINSLLAGKHTLVVMPTGAGKSLIYQFAALQLEGITLVISPLIALMQDQVAGLQKRGIAAAFVNSTLTKDEQSSRMKDITAGITRIIYASPERLRNPAFIKTICAQKIALLAVDEAHCISEWGHDFRPDYLHLAQARAEFGHPLTAALTATATPHVQQDIISGLKLGNTTTRIVTGFNRPNLCFSVRYVSGLGPKLLQLRNILSPEDQGATIIYTGTRNEAEEVAGFLTSFAGIPTVHYHAGMLPEDRIRVEKSFLEKKIRVIAATNAFGMGIDRSDVRRVIHFNLPGSLEAYYQEAGRAGRDGEPAEAVLLYDPQDRSLQEFFIENSILSTENLKIINNTIWDSTLHGSLETRSQNSITITSVDEISMKTELHPVTIRVGISMLESAGALEHLGDTGRTMTLRRGEFDAVNIEKVVANGRMHGKHRHDQLEKIIEYAETNACRRVLLLKYFGDLSTSAVEDCCDNCKVLKTPPGSQIVRAELTEDARTALVILDCIRRMPIGLGRSKIAKILLGSKAVDILTFHYDRNIYYGRLAGLKKIEIELYIEQLLELGYLKTIGGKLPTIKLSPAGEAAIRDKANIPLSHAKTSPKLARKHGKAELAALGTIEQTHNLYTQGLTVEAIAVQRGLTTYTIYNHLARLIERGLVNLSEVISEEMSRQIESAIDKAGSSDSLSAIKALLPEEIEYWMIRAVIASRKSIQNGSASPVTTIEDYLSKSHPRLLKGPWGEGWSLGFHSRIGGSSWSRSEVGDLIYRFKYGEDLSVLPQLVEKALQLVRDHPELIAVDMVVPVPSTSVRDFNPVIVFSETFAKAAKLPVQSALTKARPTRPQKEMKTMAQKRANVANAFRLTKDVRSRRILVVDDLYDSGATLNEITRLLIKGGVKSVHILTLSSTIHNDA